MAQGGKFSNPRPYRDEERQIEETFRQLTEEKPAKRRIKPQQPEEPLFSHTMQEIQEEPLFSQTLQEITEQDTAALPQDTAILPKPSVPAQEQPTPIPQQPKPEQAPAAATPAAPAPPRTPAPQSRTVPVQPQKPPVSRQSRETTLIPEDVDRFFQNSAPEPELPEDREMDFVDKLAMYLGKTLGFCRKNRALIMFAACAVILALIVGFAAAFFAGTTDTGSDDGKILSNVLLADIDVGGMTKSEAVSTVKRAVGSAYTSESMVIDLSGTELVLSPKDTKAELDVVAAVEAAYAYGRTGTQSEREQALADSQTQQHIIGLLPYLELDTAYIKDALTAHAEDAGSTLTQTAYGLEGPDPELATDKFDEDTEPQTLVITMGTPGIGFDVNDVYNKVLDAYSLRIFLVEVENVTTTQDPDPIDLESIYEEFYIKPIDDRMDLQTFKVIPGSYGYEFDLEEAQKLVDKAEFGDVLRIPMVFLTPELLEEAELLSDTLGECQTRQTSHSDRNRNLDLACDAINGYVMDPGETLSFSDVLGQRTTARGYKYAPEDTGVEETIGGGINQVASTLYYAALMADLDIVSRSNNNFVPSYAELGLDATASLTIRNSTAFPVSIEAKLSGGFVSIRILGTEERDYYVLPDYSVTSTNQPQVEYVDFEYNNAEGYLDGDVIQEGITGYQVKTYKVKYDSTTNRELSQDYVASSVYPVTNQLIARVEEPVTEPPTQPPTEAPKPTETTPPPTETTAPPPATTVPPTQATEPPAATAATEPPVTTTPTQPAQVAEDTTTATEAPAAPVDDTPEESSTPVTAE